MSFEGVFGKGSGPRAPPASQPSLSFSPSPPSLPSSIPKTFDFHETPRSLSPPIVGVPYPGSSTSHSLAISIGESSLWGDRKGSIDKDFNGHKQKRPFRGDHDDLGTTSMSKISRFEDLERNRSPPFLGGGEDLMRNSNNDITGRPSVSPPRSRETPSPYLQPNQRSSPSAHGMNAHAAVNNFDGHSVPKRARSPPSSANQVSLLNSYSIEDGTERELQAKAKRLARFKAELEDPEESGFIQSGSTFPKKKFISARSDPSVMEKQKSHGGYSSGSAGDLAIDVDNEDHQLNNVIVGLCPDMCPELERAERERKGDLDQYERVDGDRNQTSKDLAVKKYNRTAEREAELIRPMPILLSTMDYLLSLLDQPYDDGFLGLYNFLWDRMRAIRMDLRMQHIFNSEAIIMLEQMIRLHIIAMHELCEYTKGEGFSEGFDAHLNIEQMNKTSVELFQMYDDHRKRGIFIPTEKEFRGYYALLKLDKHPGYKVEPAELSLDLAKMTPEIRQTQEVLFARDVARSCRTGNFIAFFRLARKASYLQTCLMHAHFSKLRTQALASLHSGLQNNQGLPVAHVAKWLGMEGEDIESLLQYYGFLIKEFEEPYMVKEGQFLNSDKDYPTQCSKLVHSKKLKVIVEDVLSSHQPSSPQEEKKELRVDDHGKNKRPLVQPIQAASSRSVTDEEMTAFKVASPRVSTPDWHIPKTSRVDQLFRDDRQLVSTSSPKGSLTGPKAFVSSPKHSSQVQIAPQTSAVGPCNANDRQMTSKTSAPSNLFVPNSVPEVQPSNFGWFGAPTIDTPSLNSKKRDVQSQLKAAPLNIMSGGLEKERSSVSFIDSHVDSSLPQDMFMEEVRREEATDVQEVEHDKVIADYYDKEVAEAKLRLLIRLWRRRFLRRKELREQNRLAANAALNSLSLGPPIRKSQNKPSSPPGFDIDQFTSKIYEKRDISWSSLNVSEIIAGKLSEINPKSECISWKLVSFSPVRTSRNQASNMPLGQWLRHKLMPARTEACDDDLIISSPGLSIWRKWVHNPLGGFSCCLSVIKNAEPDNFKKSLVGTSAILYQLSESTSWNLQKIQLHNLVESVPPGARLPLLILSGSIKENPSDLPSRVVRELGLHEIDTSRIGSFLVVSLDEGTDTDHLDEYLSDERLVEGLKWLASESHPQPVLRRVKTRELVLSHLNPSLGALDQMGAREFDPKRCISAFNGAVDLSIKDIVSSANANPIGWPCPELSLLDYSTNEFKAVNLFLPVIEWSSSDKLEPIISSLRQCKLPAFQNDDVSWLAKGSNLGAEIEDQGLQLQDCLIKYLTQSCNLMNLSLARKEANVMIQKCTRLELHNTTYYLVPIWVQIFRRVFNWQLNRLADGACSTAYVLQDIADSDSVGPEASELELPTFLHQPPFGDMFEVSCSPVVSKRVKPVPEPTQLVTSLVSNGYDINVMKASNSVANDNPRRESDEPSRALILSHKAEKEADTLSKLLERCNVLQDEIEKKLSIYF